MMNVEIAQQLCKLGFLPFHKHLPHCGTLMLMNLEKFWVQNLQRQKSQLIENPKSFEEDTYGKLAAKSNFKSVSFIEDVPVYTNHLSRLCDTCTGQPEQLCHDGTLDVSTLGFTEDKYLNTCRFYPDQVSHAGLVELDQMRLTYSKQNIYFRLLNPYTAQNFVIEDDDDHSISLIYRSGDINLLIQKSKFFNHQPTKVSVLHTVSYLSTWYLTAVLNKFSNDNHPIYAAFHPQVAPFHVGVVPADIQNQDIKNLTNSLVQNLNGHGILTKVFHSNIESGRFGVPFDVIVDENCVIHQRVTLFDRRNNEYHTVPNIKKLPEIFNLYWNSVID